MKEAINISDEEFEVIREEVKAFLSRDNLQTHFVKRPCKYSACMETHRLVKRKSTKQMSYGRYDVRENIVVMISENLAEPALRSDAFRYWLGHELTKESLKVFLLLHPERKITKTSSTCLQLC